MSRKSKKKINKIKLTTFIIATITIIVVIVSLIFISFEKNKEKELQLKQEKLQEEITKHYNNYVITNKESDIYAKEDEAYKKIGKIGTGQELTLEEKEITYEDEYLKIITFEKEYYIYYKDVDTIEKLNINQNNRYKKYIPFNENIKTKNNTNFYDEEENLIYTLNESFEFPIIIKKEDIYGIEFNNRLLYIKETDILEKKEKNNTKEKNTKGIAVLNYHFFFDADKPGESADCNQSICLSTSNLKKHLNYIQDNNFFTPTMKELEMYIDGHIQLPKSVVLTIDDGWRADIGSNIMAEYKLNGTVFLMSNDYDPNPYKNEYIEVHSHGHDLHKQGICPGGQGGAIKCLNKEKLLEDLKASQDKLYGTTVFCYPFYEYNNYSIEVLKEAGYTMAFGGYGEAGNYKVKPGINKYKLPRYVITISTTANNIASYIN